MNCRNDKNMEKEITDYYRSEYSMLWPTGYYVPEETLHHIEEEVMKLVEDCLAHNLIDCFSIESMKKENEFFIDRIIHHMFQKPLIELKKQKIVKDKEGIETIKMLQKAELQKEKAKLDYAKGQMRECELLLGNGSNIKSII